MDIRDLIKNRRKELNLTLLDIAKACDVSEATVSRWESGDIGDMKRSRIASLAKVLKISPSIIVGDLSNSPYEETLIDPRFNDFKFALLHGENDLSEEQKQDLLDYYEFIKSKKR